MKITGKTVSVIAILMIISSAILLTGCPEGYLEPIGQWNPEDPEYDGTTDPSNSVELVPVAPGQLSAEAISNNRVDLRWQDNSGYETGYKVYRRTESDTVFSEIESNLDVDTTAYTDNGVEQNTRYYYQVCAFNSAGNSAMSLTADVLTPGDTVPPTVVISSAFKIVTVSQPIPLTITFSEEVRSFIESDITIETTEGTASIGNFTTNDNIVFTCDISGLTDQVEVSVNIGSGICSDLAGNGNLAADEWSIEYNTKLPVPHISSSSASPTNSNPVTLTIEFMDGPTVNPEPMTNFVIGDIGVSSGTLDNFQTVSASEYTVDLTFDTDGTYTIDVPPSVCESSDTGYLNADGVDLEIIYDTVSAKPAGLDLLFTDDKGVSNTDNITNDTSLTITGTSEANASVEIFVNSVSETTITADATGDWSFYKSDWTEGSYDITAVATDTAGNVSVESDALSIIVDTSIAEPAVPDLPAADDTYGNIGSDSDNITSESSFILVGSGLEEGSTVLIRSGSSNYASGVVDSSGNYSISLNSVSDGSYSFYARVTDIAGNTDDSSILPLTVDTTCLAPVIAGIDPGQDTGDSSADGITQTNQNVSISGSGEADALIRLYIDHTVIGTCTPDHGSWSDTLFTSQQPDGSYGIHAVAEDPAGNVSINSTVYNLVIDNSAPETQNGFAEYYVLESDVLRGWIVDDDSGVIPSSVSITVDSTTYSFSSISNVTNGVEWTLKLSDNSALFNHPIGTVMDVVLSYENYAGVSSPGTVYHIRKGQNKDLNGDGYPELAYGNTVAESFITYGGSPLNSTYDTQISTNGSCIDMGDVNGDGYGDFIFYSYGIYIVYGSSSQIQSQNIEYSGLADVQLNLEYPDWEDKVIVTNIDEDQKQDLVVYTESDSGINAPHDLLVFLGDTIANETDGSLSYADADYTYPSVTYSGIEGLYCAPILNNGHDQLIFNYNIDDVEMIDVVNSTSDTILTTGGSSWISSGYFNDDDYADLVLLDNYKLKVYYGNSSGINSTAGFTADGRNDSYYGFALFETSYVNNDAYMDIYAIDDDIVYAYFPQSNGSGFAADQTSYDGTNVSWDGFALHRDNSYITSALNSNIVVRDMNSDGNMNLIINATVISSYNILIFSDLSGISSGSKEIISDDSYFDKIMTPPVSHSFIE